MGPPAGEWRRPGGAMLFSLRWLLLYQCLRPEAGARLVLGFSMPIAWPAVADGVVKGTAPNRAVGVRLPVTVATWLLMVVAVIVWNSGIGFFAYGSMIGHKYGICKGVASIWGVLRGRAGLGTGGGRRLVCGGRLGRRERQCRMGEPSETRRCRLPGRRLNCLNKEAVAAGAAWSDGVGSGVAA